METYNLYDEAEFTDHGAQKKLVYDSDEVRWALFCLEQGQSIPVHESGSRVSICVLEGEGEFLGNGPRTSVTAGRAGSLCVFEPREPHGFRAKTRCLVMAGITPRP